MSVKEQLLNLVGQVQDCGCDVTDVVKMNYVENDVLVNHLIANGVTVQEFGHWNIIMDDYDCEMMQCSVCKSEFYDGDNDTVDCMHNYCPHCGAKMMPEPPKGE